MRIAFVALVASSNNPKNAKIIQLSITLVEQEDCIESYNSFIKPVPRFSQREREFLPIPYPYLKNAVQFCEVAAACIPLLENSQTVFIDFLSERLFRKAFKDIGYPLGKASFILQQLYKIRVNSRIAFSLPLALQTLGLKISILKLEDTCVAMQSLFFALGSLSSQPVEWCEPISYDSHPINFSALPPTAGVYFFRNSQGEVIYVGKANNILKRVRSHFSDISRFERELCAGTTTLDFEETGNETLALLLESHYITTLKPKYNTHQISILDPYIITCRMDGKGVLRIQAIKKAYIDNENEFYFNRQSVLKKILEVQRKFHLCRRFTNLEKTSGRCSDTELCTGICAGLEDKTIYNERVRKALKYIGETRKTYALRLPGRTIYECAVILIKNGIYQGFGFIDNEIQINSFADIEGHIRRFSHTYYTNRILDQFKKTNKDGMNIMYF